MFGFWGAEDYQEKPNWTLNLTKKITPNPPPGLQQVKVDNKFKAFDEKGDDEGNKHTLTKHVVLF